MSAVKERVNLAREVDVMDLRATKESKEIGWLEKTAEEVDIMLDEFEAHNEMDDDEDGGRGSRKDDVAEKMKLIKLKKKELARMLQAPIFPRGYSYKYPTATGQLSVPLMGAAGKDGAVAVMRDAMDKDKVKEKGKAKESSVLMGDHLKNHKGGKRGANNKKKPVVKVEESAKDGVKRPGLGRKRMGKPAVPDVVTEDTTTTKGKGGTKYYMPQPKTGKAKKGYNPMRNKKAKPAKV